jgi:hypothetical protein
MDWEILEFENETTKHALLGRVNRTSLDNKVEKMSRVRVLIKGRLGISLSAQNTMSLNEQLDQAIEKAIKGPYVTWPLCHKDVDANEDLAASSMPAPSKINLRDPDITTIETRKLKYKFLYRSGHILQHSKTDMFATVSLRDVPCITPVARVNCEGDELHTQFVNSINLLEGCEEGELLAAPWLFSPIALSKIAYRKWHGYLTSDHPGDLTWPAGTSIRDRGYGPKVDLEGTVRHPVTFVFDGELITIAHNQLSADRAKVKPTGHGSLDGRFIWDLCVGSSSNKAILSPIATNHAVVVDAHVFTDYQDKNLLLSLSIIHKKKTWPKKLLVELSSITNLFETSRWCGPTQYGIGQWSSPWLELDDPQKVLRDA